MFPLPQTRPCLALPPGSAHPSPSSSGNFQTFQHFNLSTVRQGVRSSLSTAPLTPFPATLSRESQLIENPAALSPVLATLTRHLHHNAFVCHSYKKHRGSHLSNQKSLRSGFSRPNLLPTRHSPPATSRVHLLPPVTSHQSRITNSFIIRTSIKPARNPFGIRTSKTQHLKPFRMNTYKKTGEGAASILIVPRPEARFCQGRSWPRVYSRRPFRRILP